ncbi:MAG: Asp-tRNA(Asn)/Glu-tRNA(Gln) amidotransferase subunit GatB [bacterium]|nr:Asp-tRNA(Asn)/Glu-tRNA(Gln) amidotransferase subunit GatB [bacterium]
MKNDYELTVGLEIHAELSTATKMFCDSKNPAGSRQGGTNGASDPPPNTDICPVCMGYPGTLPVINKEAVRSVLRLGVAVGGEIADYTEFDRKNYFYPDIPKGYQISQYKHPLVSGGELAGVSITRIHLEEDTAKSLHELGNPVSKNLETKFPSGESYLDFNRAGVPLVELVTEPVIHDPEAASRFAREFQLLLTYLGIAHANMEKGEMRVEANVSVSRSDLKRSDSKVGPLGTKVEVKNLNSFRAVEKAIKFEMDRQIGILEKGERVVQETRGWDEKREETVSQRVKEESHDYRYFPDPDLPKLFIKDIPDFVPETLRQTMPELPWEKRERLLKLGISKEHAEIYVTQPEWGKLFDETVELLGGETAKLVIMASNYITSDLKVPIPAEKLVVVVRMVAEGVLSSRGAKDILKIIQEKDGDPRVIAEEKNLIQISDREVLKQFVEEVLSAKEGGSASPDGGKDLNINYLVGQAMKKSEGRANPVILQELFLEMLDG